MIVADVISCADMDIDGVWGVVNEDNDVISGVDVEQLSEVVQDVFVCVVLTPGVVCDSDTDENGVVWGVVNETNDLTVSVVVTVAFP